MSTYRYAVHPTARLRGSPVLLVSPLGACGVAFDLRRGNSLVEHLVGEGRSCTRSTTRTSSATARRDAGPADLQRWVDEILPHVVRTVSAHHGGAPVHVVGWSIGGLMAVLAAAAHPDLPLASVTALATPFALDECPRRRRPPAGPVRGRAGAGHAADRPRADAAAAACCAPSGSASLDELLTAPLTVLAHLDDRDFLAQLEAVDDLRALIGDQARLVGTYFRAMVGTRDLAVGRVPVGRGWSTFRRHHPGPARGGRGRPGGATPRGPRRPPGADRDDTRLTTTPGGHLGVLAGATRADHDVAAPLRVPRPPRRARGPRGLRLAGRRAAAAHPPSRGAPPRRPRRYRHPWPVAEARCPPDDGGTRRGRRRSSRLPAPKRATSTRGRE